jgi:hypothetical protein
MSTTVLGSYNYTDRPTVGGTNVALITDLPVSTPVILSVYSGNTVGLSGTSIIPANATVPLITGGTQIWTQTVTPASVTSKFLIHQDITMDASLAMVVTIALFSGTTCIYAAGTYVAAAGRPVSLAIHKIHVPAVTTAVTYSARVGIASAATWYVNRGATVTYGGTANATTWSIMEIA